MAIWTSDRIAALRRQATDVRAMVPEPDPPDIAIEHERAVVDTENEQAAAYAAGLYQGQQVGYNPDAAAFDPDPDL